MNRKARRKDKAQNRVNNQTLLAAMRAGYAAEKKNRAEHYPSVPYPSFSANFIAFLIGSNLYGRGESAPTEVRAIDRNNLRHRDSSGVWWLAYCSDDGGTCMTSADAQDGDEGDMDDELLDRWAMTDAEKEQAADLATLAAMEAGYAARKKNRTGPPPVPPRDSSPTHPTAFQIGAYLCATGRLPPTAAAVIRCDLIHYKDETGVWRAAVCDGRSVELFIIVLMEPGFTQADLEAHAVAMDPNSAFLGTERRAPTSSPQP